MPLKKQLPDNLRTLWYPEYTYAGLNILNLLKKYLKFYLFNFGGSNAFKIGVMADAMIYRVYVWVNHAIGYLAGHPPLGGRARTRPNTPSIERGLPIGPVRGIPGWPLMHDGASAHHSVRRTPSRSESDLAQSPINSHFSLAFTLEIITYLISQNCIVFFLQSMRITGPVLLWRLGSWNMPLLSGHHRCGTHSQISLFTLPCHKSHNCTI